MNLVLERIIYLHLLILFVRPVGGCTEYVLVHVFQLWCEVRLDLGSFGLHGGRKQSVLHTEGIRVKVYVFHLDTRQRILEIG